MNFYENVKSFIKFQNYQVRFEKDFLDANKEKFIYKLVLTLRTSKFQVWSTILKVVKVTSLQYFKKEVGHGVYFFM